MRHSGSRKHISRLQHACLYSFNIFSIFFANDITSRRRRRRRGANCLQIKNRLCLCNLLKSFDLLLTLPALYTAACTFLACWSSGNKPNSWHQSSICALLHIIISGQWAVGSGDDASFPVPGKNPVKPRKPTSPHTPCSCRALS